MGLNADDIIKIMRAAKEMGILEEEKKPVDVSAPETVYAEVATLDMPSDEEVLYWATPYYDQIQAEKEAKKERIKEEVQGEEHG
jgi:hypothetical protein